MSIPSNDLEVEFDLEEERIDLAEEVRREQEQEAAEGNQATETPAATAREAEAFDVFEVFDGNPPAGGGLGWAGRQGGSADKRHGGPTSTQQPSLGRLHGMLGSWKCLCQKNCIQGLNSILSTIPAKIC